MPEILGKDIGSIGYGLMGLTWRPQPVSEEQAFKAMKASLAKGCNFWNAGEFYGTPEYNSLHLLEKYFAKYPEDAEKVVLSIKGALKPDLSPDGTPEGLKRSIDNCLSFLNGKKKIDVFEMARVDKATPLEVTMNALEGFVKEGKIGGIALSEVSAATIQKAAGLTKIVAVELEVSLFSTDIFTSGAAAMCADLNIPIVAYSPLSRGLLTGEIKSPDDIPEGDFRRYMPRFQPENFQINLDIIQEVLKLANKKGITPAQLAINWVKAQSQRNGNPVIIPIPGATTVERVDENAKEIELTDADLSGIDALLKKVEVAGGRYPDAMVSSLDA